MEKILIYIIEHILETLLILCIGGNIFQSVLIAKAQGLRLDIVSERLDSLV
jgi:hypothetical protein